MAVGGLPPLGPPAFLFGQPLNWQADGTTFQAYLRNFLSDCDTIELSAESVIRKRTDDDDKLWEQVRNSPLRLGSAFAGFDPSEKDRFVLEVREGGATFTEVRDKAREKLDAVLTALWIVKRGPVTLGQSIAYQDQVLNWDGWLFWQWGHNPFALSLLRPYELKEDEALTLQRIYGRTLVNTDERINLAIRRFRLGYGRQSQEDRLIDFWIALEALFSPTDGEIRYRIALRVGYFIEKSDVTKREQIYSHLRNS